MTQELTSFEDAAAAAMKEIEQASSTETEVSMPEAKDETIVVDGDAEAKPDEQADSQTETTEAPAEKAEGSEEGKEAEVESLFGDIDVKEAPAAPDLSSVTLEVPGEENPVSIEGLRDGYMMGRDYTQKTQAVAAEKKANQKAVDLWAALQSNPEAVVRQLAVEAGLIDEGAGVVKTVEFSPIATSADVEEEVSKRVDAAVLEHPAIIEAQRTSAFATIEAEFDRIGTEAGVTISPADRSVVIGEAQRRGVTDLELVFSNLMSQKEKAASQKQALKDAAPARPTGTTSSEVKEHADSFDEAAEMARIELGLKT